MQFLVIVLLYSQIAAPSQLAGSGNPQVNEIIHRHKDFAVSRLKDDDPDIAAQALDALATLDFGSYKDQLRGKLHLSSTNRSLQVALRHLIKRATPDDLSRVHEIVFEAARQGEKDGKQEPFSIEGTITEFLALEVLLASENVKAVEFATNYLEETITRSPSSIPTQIDLALDLIGRYSVKSASDKLKAAVVPEWLHDAVLSALAKNGQPAALKTLEKRMESMQDVQPILRDGQLVDKLRLTPEQLKAVYQKGDRLVRILTAGQLARTGRMEELHAVTQDMLAKPDTKLSVTLEFMIAEYGDDSFVLDLDALGPKDASLGGLGTSKLIFQVVNRTKPATRS